MSQANLLVNETMMVVQQVQPVMLPCLSFWLQHERECRNYRDVHFETRTWPLPPSLAAIVKRDHQTVLVDSATMRYLHGRHADLDWRIPVKNGMPPRLVGVTVGARLTQAEMQACGGEGVGQVLDDDMTWADFIERFKERHAV